MSHLVFLSLTIQLAVGRLAILHLHTSNSEPWSSKVSPSHLRRLTLDNDNLFLFLQNRSPILTATSPFFRNHYPFTLDLIRSILISSTISPAPDGIAIDYQKRRKTLTSPFCTAPWRSSFRPFLAMDYCSAMLSIFSFTSHTPLYNVPRSSISSKVSNILSNTFSSSGDRPLIHSASLETSSRHQLSGDWGFKSRRDIMVI